MDVKDFTGYRELVRPLPNEEDRVFDAGKYNKVCYRAYRLALAEDEVTKRLVILVSHGGGCEIHNIESQWISREPLLTLAKNDERGFYAILFSMYKGAVEEGRRTERDMAIRYQKAFVDNRLKKRKARGSGSYKVWIEPVIQTVTQPA